MHYAQYLRLHVHVCATNRAVVRKAHRMLLPAARRSSEMRQARHDWLRAILAQHADARDEVARFRLLPGGLSCAQFDSYSRALQALRTL